MYWATLLEAERLYRYYAELADRENRKRSAFGLAIEIGAFVVAVLAFIQTWLIVVGATATGVGIIAYWSNRKDYAQRSARAAITSDQCNEIASEMRRLWRNQEQVDEQYVTRLEEKLEAATSTTKITSIGLPNDKTLNQKCTEKAYGIIVNEFS